MTQDNKKKNIWIGLLVLIIILGLGYFFVSKKSTAPIDIPAETPSEVEAPPVTTPRDDVDLGYIKVHGLEIGMPAEDAESKIEALLNPKSEGGQQTYTIRRTPQTEAGYSIVAVADKMQDDSVQGQEIVATFAPSSEGGIVLKDFSSRVKCYRGSDAGKWQNRLCP